MSSEQTEKETSKTEEKHKNEPLIDQKELINLTKNALKNIIESDPLLNDLPPDPTIDEITAQIELVKGQSIKLFLDRGRLPKLTVVVSKFFNLCYVYFNPFNLKVLISLS